MMMMLMMIFKQVCIFYLCASDEFLSKGAQPFWIKGLSVLFLLHSRAKL